MSEFGWAYVVGTQTQGGTGAVQVAQADGRLSGSTQLKYSESSPGLLQLTGSLVVSGAITANQYNVNVVNRTITNLSSSGNTKFGDTSDDTHIFTGSMDLSGTSNPLRIQGLQPGTKANESSYLALDSGYNLIKTTISYPVTALNNQASGRLVAIGDTTTELNGQANLTFNGTTLALVGDLSSSVGISSSVGQFTDLTGSNISGSGLSSTTANIVTVNATTVSATSLDGTLTTNSQPNITSVGTLGNLTVSGDLTVDSSVLKVDSTSNRVGIGTTAPRKALEVSSSSEQLRLTYSKYVAPGDQNRHTDLYTDSSGYLILSASGERVGIGTTSPTRTLDVNGDVRIAGNLEITGTLSARVADFTVSANNIVFGDSASDSLTFNAASGSLPNGLNLDSNTWVIDSATNRIGIGTASPTYVLDVETTTASAFRVKGVANGVDVNCGIENTGTDSDDGALLSITAQANAGDPTLRFAIPATETWSMGIDNSDNDKFKISQNSTLHTDTRLTIAGGSIGIGTSTPEAKLHVTGDFIATGNLAVTGSITGSHLTDGTTIVTGGNISGVNTLTATNLAGTLTTTAQPNIQSVGTLSSLTISGDLTVDTDVFKVDSSGNKVAIGRPDPVRKLDVLSTNPQLRLAYSRYVTPGTQNIHSDLYTTNSGYLILSASAQRVGIGTDTPTRMLDVEGNTRIAGNLEVSGTLSARVTDFIVQADTIIFGDSETDTVIFNSATGTIMNGLNWDNDTFVLDSDQNRIGVGIEQPDTKLHVLTTNNQLKLSYDAGNNATFSVKSTGDLEITPTGNFITASSGLKVSGSAFLGTLSSQHTVVSGELTASIAVSSSLGRFTELTASAITNGTVKITGADVSGVNTLTAINIGGTLSTNSQPNIQSVGTLSGLTVSGDLNVDSNSLFVKSSNNRIGLGRADPERKLDVFTTDPQLRLTYSKFAVPGDLAIHSDLYTDSSGFLTLSGSGGKTKIDNSLQVTGLSIGTGVTTKYLALDSDNNIILTSSVAPGIETRNRRVITANSTLSADDYYVGLNASGDITLTLLGAETLANGQTFTIKDEGGTASSHTLTISASGSQKIDGQGTVVLSNPFAAVNLYTNGVDKYFIF
jgi:hypothetical protein